MYKIYYLSTCNTCKRIISETGISTANGFEMQDIKTERITEQQLDDMKKMAGSYEAVFSRRSNKYKELGLKDKTLGETDFRQHILEEYTFLKRPIIIIGDKIFAGSEKKTIAGIMDALR